MHFLCLHGLGTNSYVLETQTAAIRYEIDQYHTYDFAEGCESCDIAPEIRGYYANHDTYFNYYVHSADSVSKALSQLEEYIEEEGPFDGVIAFSQGAALISTFLIDLNRRRPGTALPFRCAILFSGSKPIDTSALADGEFRFLDRPTQETLLNLPTGLIWGRDDMQYGDAATTLAGFYDESQREVLLHNGGHEIPGPRAKDDVQGCVRIMRRIIERASVEQ